MSFGKNKQPKVDTRANDFWSPFGSVRHRGKDTFYSPNLDANQQAAAPIRNQKMTSALSSIPTDFNINTYYDNPFYKTTRDMYTSPVLRQFGQDSEELSNQLNARNQSGSSFEALSRRNLQQGRDFNLGQAENQARMASAGAYGDSLNYGLQALQGLRSDQTQDIANQFLPLQMATGNQSALNPLVGMQTQMATAQMALQAQKSKENEEKTKMALMALAACWVAREVYGVANPKWLDFRGWMLNKAPESLRSYYLTHGPEIAERIKDKPTVKDNLRNMMDSILEAA